MKTILKLLLLGISNLIFAQPVLTTTSLADANDRWDHTNNGNYAMDVSNERNQYVGLWQYHQDGVLFELQIELKNKQINKIEYDGELLSYNYKDIITLKYKLIKNDIEIYSTLNQNFIPPVISYGVKRGDSSQMTGKFLDYTRNVYADYTITKLNTTPEKIIFEINELHYTLLNPPSFYINSGVKLFTIPTGAIEMIKVD